MHREERNAGHPPFRLGSRGNVVRLVLTGAPQRRLRNVAEQSATEAGRLPAVPKSPLSGHRF